MVHALRAARERNLVDQVFGVIGGAVAPLWDACVHTQTSAMHMMGEGAAMNAALGYGVATGRPALVAVTCGPGLSNTITGCVASQACSVPVVVLSGEVEKRLQGRGALQDGSARGARLAEVVRPVAKAMWTVEEPGELRDALCEAFRLAVCGRPGPVVLQVPFCVALKAIASPCVRAPPMRGAVRLDSLRIESLVADLVHAERPLIIAGSGCRGDAAKGMLREVVERMGIPVCTTPQGKGCFPETHALALGCIGYGGHPRAESHVARADMIVVLGSALGETSTGRFTQGFDPAVRRIRVDVDASRFLRPGHCDETWACTVEVFLDALLAKRCPPARMWISGVWSSVAVESGADPRLRTDQAMIAIHKRLPADAFHILDCGDHTGFGTHFLRLNDSEDAWVENGFGELGSGVAATIGAKVACPKRTVVGHCGDQGFMCAGNELANCVRDCVAVLYVVYDDARMAAVEIGMRALELQSPKLRLHGVDLGEWAKSMGAVAHTVQTVAEIERLPIEVFAPLRPTVIVVKISQNCCFPRRQRVEEMARVGTGDHSQ